MTRALVFALLVVALAVPATQAAAALGDACETDADCVAFLNNTICYAGTCSCQSGYGPANISITTEDCSKNYIGNATCGLCNNQSCEDLFQLSLRGLVDAGLTFEDVLNSDDQAALIAIVLPVTQIMDQVIGQYCTNYGPTAFGCECCTYSGQTATCPTLNGFALRRCAAGRIGMCSPADITDFNAQFAWCEGQVDQGECASLPTSTASRTATATASVSRSPSPTPSPSASPSSPLCEQYPELDGTGRDGAELVDDDGNRCVLLSGSTCNIRCMDFFNSTIAKQELTVTCTGSGFGYAADDLDDANDWGCEPTTTCYAFRAMSDCTDAAERVPEGDLTCLTTIPSDAVGYCQCTEDVVHAYCSNAVQGDTCACACGASNAVGCPSSGDDDAGSALSALTALLCVLGSLALSARRA